MLSRSPKEFLGMFVERWWIGLILAVAVAWPIYHYSPRPSPVYRTEVTLLFESKKNRVLAMQEVVDTTLQTANELNTHMEQLRSKTFLEYLLSSFTPEETSRIQARYTDPQKPDAPARSLVEIIQPNTSVYVRRGTTIIGIGITNLDPESAALIANRYARKYIDFNLDRANTGTNSAIVFLRNQAEEMRTEVEVAEKALQAYRAKYSTASLGETKDVTLQKMASLGSALVTAQLEQLQAKSLMDKIREYQKSSRNLLLIGAIASSPHVKGPQDALAVLQSQRGALEQRYLAKHPRIIQNQLELKDMRRALEDGIHKAISDLQANSEVALQHIERLQKEISDTEMQVRQLDKVSVDYKFLEQDAATKRSGYTRIVDRLGEAKITSQMENTTIKVFDSALVPGAPSDTGAGKIVGKSIAAGVLCLLIVPLALGLVDTRIRTPNHIENTLGQKLLGGIAPMNKLSDQERANAFRLQKDEALIEGWRGIYSEMELSSALGFPKTIMVSSSVPAEGKSQIASNLAAVFAAHKRRVLLVDCDLRRPRLQDYFDVRAERGWVQWLNTPLELRPAFPEETINIATNFTLLPAGEAPANPTSMIERLCQRENLACLAERFDVIIFDTPPATIFPDALLLARYCHELVYVVRYRKIRAGAVNHTLQRFRETGISLLGVILNQLPASLQTNSGGYYSYGAYNSKYYKGYGESKKKKEKKKKDAA
ncbi:MAG: polysaccharide biosynthesis tyrosine autokinase [Verrucomicrobiota bacterium]